MVWERGGGVSEKERGWGSEHEVSLWRGTSHNWEAQLRSVSIITEGFSESFSQQRYLSPNRGQVKGRKDAGYTVRVATLKGSYFVFPAEIQRFGSGGSRLFGWVVRKISASSLYPAPVSLLSLGTEEAPLAPFRPP